MTVARLIFRGLVHYAWAHAGTLLGATVGGAVLVGALVVGDSVRASLRRLAELRLGRVEVALTTGDRLFRADIFGHRNTGALIIQPGAGMPRRTLAWAPALHLPAVASKSDGAARANEVSLVGVDERFWTFAPKDGQQLPLAPDGVGLNVALARQLGAKINDEIVLRASKPSALSSDAPLAPEERTTVARRLRVQAIVEDDRLGRFSLVARQTPPLNAFVPLQLWSAWLEATNLANMLLVRELGTHGNSGPVSPVYTMTSTGMTLVTPPATLQVAEMALTQRWMFEDVQVQTVATPNYLELRSPRVFLDDGVTRAFRGDSNVVAASDAQSRGPFMTAGVLTYFVNELRLGNNATPYSTVTAAGPPIVPQNLKADEVLVSQWLADDLGARAGDEITMTYYIVGRLRQLEERSARFRVRGVLPTSHPSLERNLMPDFPGLARADNCRDWDTGLPIQTERIRPKDEEYWRDYRGTPKAFISLAAGQRIWSNRFGNLTAIRYYAAGQDARISQSSLAQPPQSSGAGLWKGLTDSLRQSAKPDALGLRFQPVRDESLASSSPSQDFGQLFLGFSLFLVVAALILMALLLQFALEQRASETGTLLAMGFKCRQVRRILIVEVGVIAVLGALLGACCGPWYARAMLTGLATSWNEAIGGVPLIFHAEFRTIALGTACAAIVCWGAMWFSLRQHTRQPVHSLLTSASEFKWAADAALAAVSRKRRSRIVAGFCGIAALLLVVGSVLSPETASAGLFFGAGSLALLGGLALCSACLVPPRGTNDTPRLSVAQLGIRNLTRRRRRSLAVIGLLACGCFLIAAIGVFRLDPASGTNRRNSGTGGFALIGHSTQPVMHDLDSSRGREIYNLNSNLLDSVSVVPFRVRDGEDASCLNLNRARHPRLLGVEPSALDKRRAFVFSQVARGLPRDNPWQLLERARSRVPDDEVPAIGDQASITWALGKKVGDTLEYIDEAGRPFRLRLVAAVANSVLQGNMVVAEDEFVRRFPGTAGYRFFLVDAPPSRAGQVSAELTRRMADIGLELVPTVERLAAFNAVQNTYLGTFQALGGLGLALGSVGLGVVVLRNVLERRGELAVLQALGWRKTAIRRLVLVEHGALLLAGLLVGTAAAALAVVPPLLARHTGLPLRTVALSLVAVLASGVVWTVTATALSLRGNLRDALRGE